MLSIAELSREQKAFNFAAGVDNHGAWCYAWVHKRGVLDKDSSDGGHDLIMMPHGGFPQVVISGAKSLSTPSFDDNARVAVCKDGKELLIGSVASMLVHTCLTLPANETFQGSPTWSGPDVLFATSGGTPNRSRLQAVEAPALAAGVASAAAAPHTIFTSEHGGGVMSWDRCEQGLVVVHRLANAMLAELVYIAAGREPRVIARDGRVEYCRPQAAFLADGRLVARLNLSRGDVEVGGMPRDVTHGLWLLDMRGLLASADGAELPEWTPLHVCSGLGEHGCYDTTSTSYANAWGVREGFVLDPTRRTLAFTARSHAPECGMADQLFLVNVVDAAVDAAAGEFAVEGLTLSSGKGCHVPIAFDGGTLVYHFRSPTELGDLWAHGTESGVHESEASGATRVTWTMPVALRAKLTPPDELVVSGRHALLYRPPPSEAAAPAIVWAHGGPMAAVSFDYNPIAAWLASLGFVVIVPNFAGSVGFGIALMDQVLGDGCGVVDLADCVACADFVRDLDGVDARRGVAIAGHSWGGFLTFKALTTPGALEHFSCGVATAGITDWFCQQRHTEVRYYDYALMGGWVYEAEIHGRAKERSPRTHVAELAAPLLVMHGEADIDVPFAQVKAFVEAARATRRDDPSAPALEFVSFEGEGHGIGGWKPATRAEAFKRLREFLRIHLKSWDFTDNPHGDLTAY